ncbi:MAG: hypothetical protein ACWA40_03500 [Planktomarina sp.]
MAKVEQFKSKYKSLIKADENMSPMTLGLHLAGIPLGAVVIMAIF